MYSARHAAVSIAIGDSDALAPDREVQTVVDASADQPVVSTEVSLIPQDVAAAFSRFNNTIFNAAFQPPLFWRRFRFYLPASVADLKITPSRPEVAVDGPLARQSARVIIFVGMTPEDPRKYANDLISYIFQVTEYVAPSAPIFSLRFVKIGTEIHQCVLDFGADCPTAQKVAACLGEVGFSVGLASPTQQVPSATFSILDVKRVLNGGTGATEADIVALFGLPPNELRVIEGFEEGLFYAALKKADFVFAWLCNPFVSGQIQRELFQSYGLLVGAVHGEHNFALKGIPYHLQKKDALASMQGSYSTVDQGGSAYEQYENQNEADDELQDFLKNKDKALDLFAPEVLADAQGIKQTVHVVAAALPPLLEDDDELIPARVDAQPRHEEGAMMHWEISPHNQFSHVAPPTGFQQSTISLLPAPAFLKAHSNLSRHENRPITAPPNSLNTIIDAIRSSKTKDEVASCLRSLLIDLNFLLAQSAEQNLFRQSIVSELTRHTTVSHADLFSLFLSETPLMQLLSQLLSEEKAQLLLAGEFLANVCNTNITHLLVRALKLNPAASNPVFLKLCDPLALSAGVQPKDIPEMLAVLQSVLDAMSVTQQRAFQSAISSPELMAKILHGCGHAGRAIGRCLLQAGVGSGSMWGEAFVKKDQSLSDTDTSFLLSLLHSSRVTQATASFVGTVLHLFDSNEATFGSQEQQDRLVGAVLSCVSLPDEKTAFCEAFFTSRGDVESPMFQKLKALQDTKQQKVGGFRLVAAAQSVTVVENKVVAEQSEDCPSWGQAMREYPKKGVPFAPPSGYTIHLSRSHGYYFFRSSSNEATYKHPVSQVGFVASPQAFCIDEQLSAKDIAKAVGVAVVDVERWLEDQRIRVKVLDNYVIGKFGIKYRDSGAGNAGASTTRGSLAEKFASVLATFSSYPNRGHAFPPLPKGWSCNLSTSYGLYYFRPPSGDPIYRHPVNQQEYRASPQAFALHLKLSAEKIESGSGATADEVRGWLEDQKTRNNSIDSFVMKELGIRYRTEDKALDGAERRRKRSRT